MSIEEIGKMAGAAVAGFMASMAAAPLRVKKQLAERDVGVAVLQERLKKLEEDESLAVLRQRVDGMQKEVTDVRDLLKRLEERASRSVSDEEFSTYTAQTGAAVTALTEKVGHATGAIEAWYRSQSR